MVQVCSGGGCVAKTSVALAPGMFLVPVGGIASIGIGIDAPAGVELDHIVGIVGILVSVLELICCGCIGILGGVSGAQKVVQQSFDRGAVAVYVCVVTTARRRGGGYRFGVVCGGGAEVFGVDAIAVVFVNPEPVDCVWVEVGDRNSVVGFAFDVFGGAVENHLFAGAQVI
ncbi:MAG: hypothetical protein BWX83_01315 [Candidatus Cloacimonetes bacterium ADurb.Bin117]|nr:MAG: hypothetical protein BWX83_01315 [Candidatus Cloacimonetes bacterium ADurb.Bin117]